MFYVVTDGKKFMVTQDISNYTENDVIVGTNNSTVLKNFIQSQTFVKSEEYNKLNFERG